MDETTLQEKKSSPPSLAIKRFWPLFLATFFHPSLSDLFALWLAKPFSKSLAFFLCYSAAAFIVLWHLPRKRKLSALGLCALCSVGYYFTSRLPENSLALWVAAVVFGMAILSLSWSYFKQRELKKGKG